MTTARVDGTFSLVFLVFNGISNVLTQDRQSPCSKRGPPPRTGRTLRDRAVGPGPARLATRRPGSVFAARPGYLAADVYDPVAQHVVSHHVTFDREGGTAARLFRSPHRYIWPAELDLMARIAGFTLESRDGGWSGEPFTADSTDHVSVYRLD